MTKCQDSSLEDRNNRHRARILLLYGLLAHL